MPGLQVPLPTDVAGNATGYLRLRGLLIADPPDRPPFAIIEYDGFATKADFNAGRKPALQGLTARVTGAAFTAYFAPAALNPAGRNPYERALAYLKTLPQYAGAVDA